MHPPLSIADPNIALILIVIGAMGIYAEFSSPGLIAPGVIGTVLALIGIASLARDPIDWRGAALILFACGCFLLEAKRTSHGAFTALGAACMLSGCILLIDSPDPRGRIHWTTALAVTLPFALVTSFLLTIAMRARRNKLVSGPQAGTGIDGLTLRVESVRGTEEQAAAGGDPVAVSADPGGNRGGENTTVNFPVPVDILKGIGEVLNEKRENKTQV